MTEEYIAQAVTAAGRKNTLHRPCHKQKQKCAGLPAHFFCPGRFLLTAVISGRFLLAAVILISLF
jgi:Zn-finger protein